MELYIQIVFLFLQRIPLTHLLHIYLLSHLNLHIFTENLAATGPS
jgi:hypothetical protein